MARQLQYLYYNDSLIEIHHGLSCVAHLSGTSPMKITSTSEVEGGGSTSVRNVVFDAKSQAC